MTAIDKRIDAIDERLTSVCSTLEQLTALMTSMNSGVQGLTSQKNSGGSPVPVRHMRLSELEDSKDILSDDGHMHFGLSHGGDRPLTPEIQVQRLSAQLTAAYGRIAALEEQLLARRMH
jgi:hypothetical protein